jgi:hypothetical protein
MGVDQEEDEEQGEKDEDEAEADVDVGAVETVETCRIVYTPEPAPCLEKANPKMSQQCWYLGFRKRFLLSQQLATRGVSHWIAF